MGKTEESFATNSLMSCDSKSDAEGLLASSLCMDVDSFIAGCMEKQSSSLRENDSALTVLENLEHYWFWDNIFNLATGPEPVLSGSSSSMNMSMTVRSCPNLEVLPSRFRSIEMVTSRATNMRDIMEGHGHGELPKPYLQRSFSALEEREKGSRVQDRKMGLEVDVSHSPPDAFLHLCSSSEDDVHDPDDGGGEPNHAKMPPSPTKVPQQLSTVPRLPKLKTILSDKQLQQTTVRRRERRRATTSMRDLEFDEVQGFIDLGFKFNMDELSPHVVSMLPGLQRLGQQGKTQRHAQPPSRPYLSEAWLIRRSDSPLLNWRMPSLHENEVDMKKHLKFWARAVSSTVQQES